MQRSEAVQAVIDWIEEHLPTLLESGENWKVTLHGGRGGDVRHEVQQFGQITPGKKYQRVK